MSQETAKLVSPVIQAERFARVRESHQMETAEDYVELIADLLVTQKEARLSDLSERFGVSHPTVSKILKRLKEEGYIHSKPYRSIFLTKKGAELALKCKERHHIIVNFLTRLGVSQETAESDSEGMEHHISEETLRIMKAYRAKPE